MLPRVSRYDVQDILQHWTPTFVVLPSLFPDRLHQASPRLFLVSSLPGPWRNSIVVYVLGQGVLPPLRTMHSFWPIGAFAPVDQLRL
jgi:hypothetical protein